MARRPNAPRGVIGIPRVLNMYEDFPFWAAFFGKLGYDIVLSGKSNPMIYCASSTPACPTIWKTT